MTDVLPQNQKYLRDGFGVPVIYGARVQILHRSAS
jgi:hypothetical protein